MLTLLGDWHVLGSEMRAPQWHGGDTHTHVGHAVLLGDVTL